MKKTVLGKMLTDYRKLQGKTGKQFTAHVDMSEQTLCKIVNGRRPVGWDEIIDLLISNEIDQVEFMREYVESSKKSEGDNPHKH